MMSNLAVMPEVMGGMVIEERPGQDEARAAAWNAAIESWLETRKAGNTQRAYYGAWADFTEFVGKPPWQVGRTDVVAWVRDMTLRELAPRSINQKLAAVSSMFSYACNVFTIRAGGREVPLYDHNPARGVDRPTVWAYDKAYYLSPEQCQALLGAIPRNTLQGLRDYALFLFYVASGRRNSEVRELRWGDFIEEGGRIYYKWAGKRKRRKDEIPLRVWNAVLAYLKAAGRLELAEGDYIFTALSDSAARLATVADDWRPGVEPISMRQVGKLLKRYARRAGLRADLIHVHSLRHTAAHLRRLAGDDVEVVSSFLAHSSIAVTQIYLHTTEGRKDESWSKVEALIGI